MTYSMLLQHRCELIELKESFVAGVPQSNWTTVATNIRCFLDLNFIRKGKDPIWTPEAGRSADRSGVLFLDAKAPIQSGMRVRVTKGPSGTFLIEGAIDPAWRPQALHHYEVGVTEVPSQISKGQGAK